MSKQEQIQVALGQRKADLVLKNARVIDVFTGEIRLAEVAIQGGRIAAVGCGYCGAQEADLQGRYLAPGFVNAHCHVESSMVTPPVYCMEELRWGVTTLITDPHEITNVLGGDGVRYMLAASQGLPVNYYVQLPSCVPATPFEHAGAVLTAEKMAPFLAEPRVLGLGEMMNYPGVVGCDEQILAKLRLFEGRVIDGHAPAISGAGLQAYVGAGICTDHESTSFAEAREKLRAGMAVLVREGSASKNLRELLSGVIQERLDTRRLAFCTDDKHLADIRREGTVRHCLRLAVDLGMPPVTAIQLATINAAQIFGLRGIGAVAPGYRADLVVLDDLEQFQVAAVYKDGICEVQSGAFCIARAFAELGSAAQSVHIAPLAPDAFALPPRETYPVIRLVPGQIVTQRVDLTKAQVQEGLAEGSLRKIAVIERHHATGNIGVGLLAGYGLTHGAVGTTVAHDSHNLIVVGDNDADLYAAVNELVRVQGGYTLVKDGEVLGSLPLPVAGLMSNQPPEQFLPALEQMLALAHRMGVAQDIDPFITLSFLALPVIPELRLTDMGMFDVTSFQFVN